MQAEAAIEHGQAFGPIGVATTIHAATDGGNEGLDFGPLRFTSIQRGGTAMSDNCGVFSREWIAIDMLERFAGASRGLAQHFGSRVRARLQAFLETRHGCRMCSRTAMQCIEVFTPNPLRILLLE